MTSKRHDDHADVRRRSTGLGTTSVLVTGHEGLVLYLVLPGVKAASAGMGGAHSSCGCLMSKTASLGPGGLVNLCARQ
jgi:hypothetical protein